MKISRRQALLLAGAPLLAKAATPVPVYVDARTLDLAAILPQPPADDQLAGRADLATVLAVQTERSAAQQTAAREDAERGPLPWLRAIDAAWGDSLWPLAEQLISRVRADFEPLAHVSPWPRRPRPVERDARVQPLIEVRHGAYPSARTASTRIWAEVFGSLVPTRTPALLAAAERSAWLRVIAGVHYPTDLEGGRLLAGAFIAALWRSDRWQTDVERARRLV
jgi:acid phosphatase (class A)